MIKNIIENVSLSRILGSYNINVLEKDKNVTLIANGSVLAKYQYKYVDGTKKVLVSSQIYDPNLLMLIFNDLLEQI